MLCRCMHKMKLFFVILLILIFILSSCKKQETLIKTIDCGTATSQGNEADVKASDCFCKAVTSCNKVKFSLTDSSSNDRFSFRLTKKADSCQITMTTDIKSEDPELVKLDDKSLTCSEKLSELAEGKELDESQCNKFVNMLPAAFVMRAGDKNDASCSGSLREALE